MHHATTASAVRPALRVGFLLAHNFTLSALSLFIDTLRLAGDDGDRSRPIRASWHIMAPRPEPLRSSCGVSVTRTTGLIDPNNFDYVVVVGGLLDGGEQIDRAILGYLDRCDQAGITLVGVCTGSFVLSRAGLMKGRRTCVSWFHAEDFAAEFPDQMPDAEQLFIDDGNRITCAGGGGVADLAAYLVSRHINVDAAKKSLHVLQLQDARQGSEAQPHAGSASTDSRVRRAILMMESHVGDPLPVDTIAIRLDLSGRQLERLFRTTLGQAPAAVYRKIRLDHARRLLETTGKSVTDIAIESGFCDGAHFAQSFRTVFGQSPKQVRAQREKRVDPVA
ncbi:transcriptional regulator, AraC family, putative [Fulvimarina pelagi HTCC2506]|uniref:Transcriptional regulator, AraC family, putative n=3 Tax=Fulvimarina pelagi TaxID=217511 RepID=Q0FZB2_9HYPH|nr:GlxA family transcriptional regulator [Fulvimarina pelagi]EAU40366.1 transcriptional regulator, AraC family, putative [Fulvimarina pelagi HTCC2506]BAT31403.1 transcriptional regulator [Fulvimarina pelagi]